MMYIHYINETYIISLANVNNASLWRHDPGYSHMKWSNIPGCKRLIKFQFEMKSVTPSAKLLHWLGKKQNDEEEFHLALLWDSCQLRQFQIHGLKSSATRGHSLSPEGSIMTRSVPELKPQLTARSGLPQLRRHPAWESHNQSK